MLKWKRQKKKNDRQNWSEAKNSCKSQSVLETDFLDEDTEAAVTWPDHSPGNEVERKDLHSKWHSGAPDYFETAFSLAAKIKTKQVNQKNQILMHS